MKYGDVWGFTHDSRVNLLLDDLCTRLCRVKGKDATRLYGDCVILAKGSRISYV